MKSFSLPLLLLALASCDSAPPIESREGAVLDANEERVDCLDLARQAALSLGGVVNLEVTDSITAQRVSDDQDAQVFDFVFDTEDGGASVTYTVTVERNPSPVVANQDCLRVRRVEITAEE